MENLWIFKQHLLLQPFGAEEVGANSLAPWRQRAVGGITRDDPVESRGNRVLTNRYIWVNYNWLVVNDG